MKTYDILQNHYNDPTVRLLLDTAQKTDNVITICGKWIFDYNLEFCITTHKNLKKFYIFW